MITYEASAVIVGMNAGTCSGDGDAMRRMASRSRTLRARRALFRADRSGRRPAAPTGRGVRGRRYHGPLPKIIALTLTSIVTIGMVAWALTPRAADPPAPPLNAVFLGDSYTVGIGGDGADWPTTVSDELGWESTNLAAGGTGYVTEAGMAGCGKEHCGAYLEQSAAIVGAPDVIIVAGGRNDPSTDIAAAAATLFASLQKEHPDALIIALSPWTDDAPLNDAFTAKISAVRTAAEEAGIIYIDTGQPFVGHPDLISADGIHPNSAGYAKLSALLTPLLAKATGRQAATAIEEPAATSETDRQDEVRAALRMKSWPQLVPAVADLGERARVPEWIEDRCLDVSESNVDECAYGDLRATQLVALLGDEHAISYLPTLRAAFPERRIQSLTLQQCPAAPVAVQVLTPEGPTGYTACDEHRAWSLNWIEEHDPQTVVIVDAWSTPVRMAGDDTVTKLREYKTALTRAVEQIAAMGSRVVVLASPPPGENLVTCRTAANTPADCVRTMPGSYSDWTKTSDDAIAQADVDGAGFIRTGRWFCATGSCPSFIADVAVFADGSHLTDAAARALAPLLSQAFTAP